MAKYERYEGKLLMFDATANNLLADIQDALGTEESGEALVEVARNAHKAELELAAIKIKEDNEKED
jgi:ribosomal protein L14